MAKTRLRLMPRNAIAALNLYEKMPICKHWLPISRPITKLTLLNLTRTLSVSCAATTAEGSGQT